MESTGVPIIRADRHYIMGVFNNITDRKRMEQALREAGIPGAGAKAAAKPAG